MGQFRFAAASQDETTIYGASRPGYPSKNVELAQVQVWICFMKEKGIQRVCCLLPTTQLKYYKADLLDEYRKAFGAVNVCWAGVEDYHLSDCETLEKKILPFFLESAQKALPVVVHCSGGSGRTGHIMAAWLVRPDDCLSREVVLV
jgi:protein-tyrosine phosphatase